MNGKSEVGYQDSVNLIIGLFKDVNPSYERLFANITQRAAIERLIAKHSFEKIEWTVKALALTNTQPFAPVITTPLQLEERLGSLIVFIKRHAAPKTVKI